MSVSPIIDSCAYRRERSRIARRAEHGEREDEQCDLAATVNGSTEQIVVLLKPDWVPTPQPPLAKYPKEDCGRDSAVDALRTSGLRHRLMSAY